MSERIDRFCTTLGYGKQALSSLFEQKLSERSGLVKDIKAAKVQKQLGGNSSVLSWPSHLQRAYATV